MKFVHLAFDFDTTWLLLEMRELVFLYVVAVSIRSRPFLYGCIQHMDKGIDVNLNQKLLMGNGNKNGNVSNF